MKQEDIELLAKIFGEDRSFMLLSESRAMILPTYTDYTLRQ